MKTTIRVMVFVFCFASTQYVWGATINKASLFSQRLYKVIDDSDVHYMLSAARVDTPSYNVYLQNVPGISGDLELPYRPEWADVIDDHLFSTPLFSPSPGSAWELNYKFYIDQDGSGDFSSGDADFNWSLPSGSIKQMGLVAGVNISAGYNPTIEWDAVADAQAYRLIFYHLGTDPVFSSDLIVEDGSGHYLYPYTGNCFDNYGQLTVVIQAMDRYIAGQEQDYYNRSLYAVLHNPVPLPGAVWLLGSGLIGLVGLRKKFKN